MKRLTVNGRYLAYEDGQPFFYLADTAWELAHRANREEITYYMSERKRQGFNVAQVVALAEFDGLLTPNFYGRLPLKFANDTPDLYNPDTEGDYSYWDHLDYLIKTAQENEIYIALLPTWGDKFNLKWGVGPVIFDSDNAYSYGKWIADRYIDNPNIIWVLGGDRHIETKEHRDIIDSMAQGIRSVDNIHLISFHPPGSFCSTDFVCDADYIDFHSAQTGHSIDRCYHSDLIMREISEKTDKPFLDMESRYESHPACFDVNVGYLWNEEDVRQNSYWNVLAGACGQTYGNHSIWSLNRESTDYFPYKWQEALLQPGAEQMRYLTQLRLKRDYFSLEYAPELITSNYPEMGHLVAAKGNCYAYIYSPLGLPISFNLDCFNNNNKCVKAFWFDPRTGNETAFAVYPPYGDMIAIPPSNGKGNDWVLVLESVSN